MHSPETTGLLGISESPIVELAAVGVLIWAGWHAMKNLFGSNKHHLRQAA